VPRVPAMVGGPCAEKHTTPTPHKIIRPIPTWIRGGLGGCLRGAFGRGGRRNLNFVHFGAKGTNLKVFQIRT